MARVGVEQRLQQEAMEQREHQPCRILTGLVVSQLEHSRQFWAGPVESVR